MSSIAQTLPAEVLERIFLYLPFKDARNAASVCHRWLLILHGPIFQRRLQVELQSDSCQEMSAADMQFLQRCKNLSIIQKFEDKEVNDPEIYTEQAISTEKQIDSILSLCVNNLESLQLLSRFDSIRNIIGPRLSELANLKELTLSFGYHCREGNCALQGDTWQLTSECLQTFKIRLANCVPSFHLNAPNLRELHLNVTCESLLKCVGQFAEQLTMLRLSLSSVQDLDYVLSCKFPQLTHLDMAMNDDRELIQSWFAQIADVSVDSNYAESFIQGMPRMQKFIVRSNVLFYKLLPTLGSVRTKLEELELRNADLDANILINILLIQNIKRLSIWHCEITNDLPGLHIRMASLENLELVSLNNNVLLDHNFCCLKSLNLSHSVKFGNDLLQKVFLNLSSVEYLQIHFRIKLEVEAFQQLHLLRNLKSLTLTTTDTTVEHWKVCDPLMTVVQLNIVNCFMLEYSIFPELKRVFPALQRLHVDKCCVLDDTSGSDAVVDGTCERKLRSLFNNIIVSWHETIQITPVTLKRLLM